MQPCLVSSATGACATVACAKQQLLNLVPQLPTIVQDGDACLSVLQYDSQGIRGVEISSGKVNAVKTRCFQSMCCDLPAGDPTLLSSACQAGVKPSTCMWP